MWSDDVTPTIPLKLDRYCVKAVRRRCLCHALGQGLMLGAARLSFEFIEPEDCQDGCAD